MIISLRTVKGLYILRQPNVGSRVFDVKLELEKDPDAVEYLYRINEE